jgi:hypothetical protein
MWLLGLLIAPVWVGMVATQLAEPERFARESGLPIWIAALPLALVAGGLVGLVGLIRVLTLSRRERPASHRYFTLGMVAVGIATLVTFQVDGGMPELADVFSISGLCFIVLPFAGAAWLLSTSWRFLFAARDDAHGPTGSTRAPTERRG